jgi:glycosyltransferase involved in cell wall biosynthesis
MRVGLNLVWLGERAGGAGTYAHELIPALLEAEPGLELHLFVSRDAPGSLLGAPWAGDVRWATLPVGLSGPPLHLPAQFAALPALALRRRLQVVHGLANVVPVRVPGVASVVTLLDLIWLHAGTEWGTPRAIRSTRALSLFCARHARRVLAISHAAADDFVATVGLDRAKLDVAPLGVRDTPPAAVTPEPELRRRLGLGAGPVVLCVAQKRPYKHQAALVRALPGLDPSVRLVLPGASTPYEDDLRALAAELGMTDRVVLPDWVDDADLEGLYALAACFALPSRIEGFGLPILEAMRRGVPVCCSDRGSLPGVGGPAAVTGALRRILGDPALAADLAARGRERVAQFTWRRTAEATLESYRRSLH